MKKALFCLIAVVVGEIGFAQDAKECKNFSVHGNIRAMMEKWDLLLATADKNKSFTKDINDFKNKHGLLLEVGKPSEKFLQMNGPPSDRLEGDHPSGGMYLMFHKTMTGFKCCSFDSVHEVRNLDGQIVDQSWNIPLEATPLAIEGKELFFEYQLRGCTNESRGVVIAVKQGGSYRVVDRKIEQTEKKTLGACSAPKKIFGAEAGGICSEFVDLKSKKKKILVWREPVT